jgi:hypothetical protein
MLAHGFTLDLITDLVDAGLASATTESKLAGGRPVRVTGV